MTNFMSGTYDPIVIFAYIKIFSSVLACVYVYVYIGRSSIIIAYISLVVKLNNRI